MLICVKNNVQEVVVGQALLPVYFIIIVPRVTSDLMTRPLQIMLNI